ncbi:iron dicitrate transport regulator FecR [Shinella sp. SUS2]|uniref:FecR family protein n=1 Tax=unclassified Shinella TaxID=2643062 RepID=UPI0006813A1D|nr:MULTISPECIES: FecR family protein [unclassified Shinella]KNY15356.1 iron dicitrate transport regulator FecR [Shinella sp. SUS2]KOC74899.1 iron dicitrate transport regulator FecR [Shinella sp. GWS1]
MPGNRATQAQRKRNREAADWLLRNGDPAQSPEERARFQQWLDDPENCRTYRAAERLLGDARTAIQSDPALRNIEARPRSLAKPAATSLALLVCAAAAFLALDGPMRLQADAIAGTAEMPVVALEDGSTVQLNATSAIAVDFTANRRTVRLLRGQAFFQVAHAPERPFTVEAGTTHVTALGTAFDVRYGTADTEVTVTENAVLIEPGDAAASSLRVSQGEQATYDRDTGRMNVQPVDGVVALAWQRGQIAVEDAPLSHVIEEMSRHFSGRIVLAGSALAQRRVSGTITVSDTDAALSFIRQALGVRVTRLGPLIVIR